MKKPRFTVDENEGSFFYEPWLNDRNEKKTYRYDQIPAKTMAAFLKEKRDLGRMNPHEARIIVDFAISKLPKALRS